MRSITPSPWPVSPLLGARESNSSKNKTDAPLYPPPPPPSFNEEVVRGSIAAERAASNTVRIFASLSPTYDPRSSGPLIERKGSPHSRATAFATRVLPVPGGPNSKMPDLRLPSNNEGYFNGNSTASMISLRTDSKPPMSSHRTLGREEDERGSVPEPPLREDWVNEWAVSRCGSRDCRTSAGDGADSFSSSTGTPSMTVTFAISALHWEINFSLKYRISRADNPNNNEEMESNVPSTSLSHSVRA
mmetsp:Transcript_32402/g.68500  ORF Transcript_32402/g.68500 Transcript_32402/m.68500 type:complete len:246 (-) Transcript_32402:696-1433(-)